MMRFACFRQWHTVFSHSTPNTRGAGAIREAAKFWLHHNQPSLPQKKKQEKKKSLRMQEGKTEENKERKNLNCPQSSTNIPQNLTKDKRQNHSHILV